MMNMIPKCSSSKQEQLDDSQSCDLLSDLPLGIIHIILALIPIREAVRTSVLSTQWRYTWTTLPHLEFENEYQSEFVTQVLFHHRGPIHKFKMSCSCPCDLEDLDELVLCLSRNDIRELDLCYDYHSAPELHSSIYSCKKITILGLRCCILDPPPLNFKGFLFLRFLSLSMVSCFHDEVNSLVAVCPLLEIFELGGLDECFELKISAPYLKYMNLDGEHGKICINAPLMTEISVELDDYPRRSDEELKSSVDYAKCFGGFSNLQKLFGSGAFTEYLSLRIELCHHSLVFHHLKVLHLDNVESKDAKEMMVVAYLVIGAPNLQELKISTAYNCRICRFMEVGESDLSFRDLGCASNFKLEKLTDVSLYNAIGNTMEVEFLKFLLESSPALETLNVVLRNDTEWKRNYLKAELEGCNWASPTVKLCERRKPFYGNRHRQAFHRVFGH